MRPIPLAAAAAVAVALTAAPAAATGSDSTFEGGCTYRTVEQDPTWTVGEPYRYTGELDGWAVLYSPSDHARAVTGTLTCTVEVNGVPVVSPSFTGTGVVAGVEPIEFVADEDDYVELCLSMDYADDTPTTSYCYVRIGWAFPPEEVWDLADDLADEVPAARDATCATTPAVPDVGTVLRSGDDGDLRVRTYRVLDCPPRDR